MRANRLRRADLMGDECALDQGLTRRSVLEQIVKPFGVIWALLERQRGRVHHRDKVVAPKVQHPRNLSGSKTAYAMATLKPRVTEGECEST